MGLGEGWYLGMSQSERAALSLTIAGMGQGRADMDLEEGWYGSEESLYGPGESWCEPSYSPRELIWARRGLV